MESVNPATGRRLRTYPDTSEREADAALREGAAAARAWGRESFAARARCLKRAAEALRSRADEYARLMAEEMGKPLAQGRSEAEKCAWVCEFYAEHAERFLAREPAEADAGKSFVEFRPLGLVLAIMPWNFPFWQVFRCAAPNLMAGNALALKHASNVSGCALAIQELLERAGLPRGLFRALIVPSERVETLIAHESVAAVTLTGSTTAGQAVASAAGKALKKTVLELGGSDPYVVLEDADLERTVETCVASRLINTGQSCIAAKRFVVVEAVLAEFTERMVERMRAKTWGDPLEGEFDLGPLARRDLREDLHTQVRRSVEAGARLLLGGEVPDGPGAFYPPTVLADVRAGSPAYSEELFGPVAAILPAEDEERAIEIANDSPFGLGAAVFTRDAARGERIASERLDAGCCFVNDFVKSDPRLPFGGVKRSGYGRELGLAGIREFVNIKSVHVEQPSAPASRGGAE
jgi:succinate-semialdehyde dehydrogenase/glutarate-semialdehyde dehydrogenase